MSDFLALSYTLPCDIPTRFLPEAQKGFSSQAEPSHMGYYGEYHPVPPLDITNQSYLSNRPQVSMVYRLISHAGC